MDTKMPKTTSLKAERGSTLVEFAPVLIVLLALTFGMIDFARYVYAISAVRSAAQEGARAGVKLEDLSNLQTVAETAAENVMVALDVSKANVVATHDTEQVLVDITYEFEFITPLLAAATTTGTIEIDGSASMFIY